MGTITSKPLAQIPLLSDEFAINRGGSDFKTNWEALYTYLLNDVQIGQAIGLLNTFKDTTVPNTYMPFTGGTFTGAVNGVAPTDPSHLTRKDYIDNLLLGYLLKAGGVMTGPLILYGNPTVPGEATNKQYVDGLVSDLLKTPATPFDCTGNPNFPSALPGTSYYISAPGKIGGPLGPDMEVGQVIIAKDVSFGGDFATAGSQWLLIDKARTLATETVPGLVRKSTIDQIEAVGNDPTAQNTYMDTYQHWIMLSVHYTQTTTSLNNYTILGSILREFVLLNNRSATGTGTVTLPSATAQLNPTRVRIHIKDSGGNASVNNITIQAQGGQTIDGQSTFVLNNNYQSVTLVTNGTNWFVI
jgi:hypothetical protein